MILLKLLRYEIARFKRRGFLYMTLAYVQALGFLYLSLKIGRLYWGRVLALHENKVMMWYVVAIIYNISLLFLVNIAWGLIYYLEIPFFE